MPFKPQTKKTGDLVQSQDWNDAIEELLRLEKDKVNRSGNDKITGPLTIEGALSAKEVTFSGDLTVNNNISVGKNVTISRDLATLGNVSIGTPTPENGHGWNRVLDIKGPIHTKLSIRTNNIDGRVLAHDSGFWGAPGGMIIGTQTDHPLSFATKSLTHLTILSNGNVGIGRNNPVAKLDISSATRIGTHPTTVKGLYITGDFLSNREGVEFRHSNGMEGIGFGYNTIYAAGSNANQDLGLQAKGTGEVKVFGKLLVSGNLTVSGKVNDRDISADGRKLDTHTHNGTDSQKVKHSDLTLDGGTNPHKTTAADVGALSNKGGTVSGSLSIVVPQLQDQIIEALVLGPTNASNLRLGYHQDYSLIQSHGSKPLLINKSGNNIGIGSIINPVAKLDIASATRTGTHPTAVKGLYITGDFKDDSDGVEFRHTNGTQGIGFGSNTIYAAGSNANQDLGLKAKGTGQVKVAGKLSVTGGVIQQGGDPITTTNDLGLYSQSSGSWMRFVTKSAPFKFFSDGGAGTTPIMTLESSGNLSVTGSLSFGSQTRQMLNLYGTVHGIGVQNNTTYFRTSDNFAWYKGGLHNDTVWNAGTGGTALMTLDASGNLVIGTRNTIKGKLHIEGFVNYQHPDGYRYWHKKTIDLKGVNDSYNAPYSVYASDFIGCREYNAFSDLRIKEIKGNSDSQADLQTLLQIQVTDYYYKDKIANGNRPKKKVIGQQVADVYPQAVSTHVDVVPDIFESAIIEENWVTLNSHNLKIGDKVKIFWNDNDSQLFTVEDIKTDQFKISLNHTGDIFVYGREVDDFHVVDYDALSMLHISATQELYKIIKKLEQKLNEKIKD